jgi:hypothetical protein
MLRVADVAPTRDVTDNRRPRACGRNARCERTDLRTWRASERHRGTGKKEVSLMGLIGLLVVLILVILLLRLL